MQQSTCPNLIELLSRSLQPKITLVSKTYCMYAPLYTIFNFMIKTTSQLNACEQRWVDSLKILSPFGLNKETADVVSDSISNMCRKSLGSAQRRF